LGKKNQKACGKRIRRGQSIFVWFSGQKKSEPGSDIDVLIVASQFENPLKRSKFYLKVNQKIGFLSPFEIHLITPKEYKEWYQYFIKEKIEIK
jgi:predicted nucleotidyltransferase